ncbi:MAG: hypothetical protein H8E34_12750 [Bacteroidetes bacterium]|nr:hypothetical protein [Bacteroidota bacterium]MBL6943803.1 hypothetical protein [Bacteroidales bacterium]
MTIKNFIIGLLLVLSIVACNTDVKNNNNDESQGYVAKIDTSLTLAQIAKLNNIGEPYLRTKLGIRQNIGNKYSISYMAKRFNFTIDDLKKIIEDAKNEQPSAKNTRVDEDDKK